MKIAFWRIPFYACTALALSAFVASKPETTQSPIATPTLTLDAHAHAHAGWHAASPSWQLLFGTASW